MSTIDDVFAGFEPDLPDVPEGRPAYVSHRLWVRFWTKVDRDPDGCWTWTRSLRVGYGAFKINGRVVGAHQLSYRWLVGRVPRRKCIDHLCGNRACVRPDHLEAVSYSQNMKRGAAPHFPAGGAA